MSHEERRSLVSIISTLVINSVYALVMRAHFPDVDAYAPEIFIFWGRYVLLLIPVTVVMKIIIYIVFVIISAMAIGDYDDDLMDERQQLIALKAAQVSQGVFALAFILAMVALVMGHPPSVMFVIVVIGGILTEVVSDATTLYYSRWGV